MLFGKNFIKIVFNKEKLPKTIAKDIVSCEDYEFHYEASSQKEGSQCNENVRVNPQKAEQEKNQKEKKAVSTEEGEKVLKRKRRKKTESEELDQIAKQSNSYEEFIIIHKVINKFAYGDFVLKAINTVNSFIGLKKELI